MVPCGLRALKLRKNMERELKGARCVTALKSPGDREGLVKANDIGRRLR